MSLQPQGGLVSRYGPIERWLHDVSLRSTSFLSASFELEHLLLPSVVPKSGKHVFVTALARSGTTALLLALYGTGCFRTLTYRDMPFVLMPRLWERISKRFRRPGLMVDRAHGDGLGIDFDSPEAFEEVFWRTFAGETYIKDDRLSPHGGDAALVRKFRSYVHAIVEGSSGRYLSKNNNNILRLPLLREAFPDASIVVLFRNPLHHAQSLLAQHKLFCELERESRFVGQYMSWLVHHEFGAGHRPMIYHDDDIRELQSLDPDTLDYWLSLWWCTYRRVIAAAPPGTVFVSYEALCDKGSGAYVRVLEAAGVDDPLWQQRFFLAASKRQADPQGGFSRTRLELAYSLYEELLAVDH